MNRLEATLAELDPDSRGTLEARVKKGEALLQQAWCPPTLADEDRESAAADAISYVLTVMVGPAGTYSLGGSLTPDRFALNEARRIVEQAFRSWEGDAEDYTREPQPGEYGYEAPDPDPLGGGDPYRDADRR